MSDQEDGEQPVPITAAKLLGSATPEQRAELKHLLRTRRHTAEWRTSLFAEAEANGLSQARALGSISYLRQQPAASDLPTEATAWQIMRLRDLATTRLAPGPIVKSLNGRIEAKTLSYDHADLSLRDFERLPLRVFPAGEPGKGIRGQDVPDGYYAIDGTDGRTRCYSVKGSQRGRRVVNQITGSRSSGRARVPGYLVNQTLDAIGVDPAGARRRYAQIAKRCTACNQPLYDDKKNPGYAAGYGPKCWSDRQAARKNADAAAALAAGGTPDENSEEQQ